MLWMPSTWYATNILQILTTSLPVHCEIIHRILCNITPDSSILCVSLALWIRWWCQSLSPFAFDSSCSLRITRLKSLPTGKKIFVLTVLVTRGILLCCIHLQLQLPQCYWGGGSSKSQSSHVSSFCWKIYPPPPSLICRSVSFFNIAVALVRLFKFYRFQGRLDILNKTFIAAFENM